MTQTSHLTPAKLRGVLVTVFVALIIIGVVIFMLGYQQINIYSLAAQETAQQAAASSSTVHNLKLIQQELAQKSDIVDRASQLVAASQSYKYQDQIIQDINSYAKAAGLSLDNITFEDASATTATTATAALPAGIKMTTATATLKNPVNYYKLLRFLHSLEQGVFKMSITSIDLSKGATTGGLEDITSSPVKIEVYIR